MEQLHNGYTLFLAEGSFPLSTDSVALAGFVKLPRQARVLDLGAGCGTLGLLLCARDSGCSVTGIELRQEDHKAALNNAECNQLSHRLSSICGDIRDISGLVTPGSYQVCVSNPPYFTGGLKSQVHAQARHTDTCTLADLFTAAEWALQYGGDFYLVHKPEMLAQICAQAVSHHLEPKRLLWLHHRQDGPVSLILLQCRKGGKPGLSVEEDALWLSDGQPTEFYKRLYHL